MHSRHNPAPEREDDDLAAPVLIRRSTLSDTPTLARLAYSSGKISPRGLFLVAEIHGAIVAAAPLDTTGEPLHDPARATADIRVLLARWAARLPREAGGDAKAA
jgi:hypothetical protein